ncbi:glycosyltransferase family 9 protein [Hyunsoonleella sp. 2307UL5-6]|uniref:glycosyltransferase family 9 protein n=1 Tax=Hyunsoonleella sp. 2307UL5-6 TaxID=3384768 RepID=UPI0039BD14F5
MKILVIQQKMIGDVLTSTIIFSALRKNYPDDELHYLVNTPTLPIIKHYPNIDKVIHITPTIDKNPLQFYNFLKTIKNEKYDIVIDVYGKWSSNFITLFSKAKTRIGYYKWYTQQFYSHPVKRHKISKNNQGLAIENRLQLLEPICKTIPNVKPKIYLTPEEIKNAKNLLINFELNTSKPLYMISVLGSGDTKTYPFKYMASVIDTIVTSTGGNILFNYIPKQIEQATAIYNLCKPDTQKHIHLNIFGKSLREFIAITYHCTALIGNEGGAINMAKAINIPTFAIFSPWIDKNTWKIFEDETKNISVHLNEFKPEIFENTSIKNIKHNIENYYSQFSPNLFSKKLKTFLANLHQDV